MHIGARAGRYPVDRAGITGVGDPFATVSAMEFAAKVRGRSCSQREEPRLKGDTETICQRNCQ